jgi:tRNA (guanine37-N1)-methyltransferase
MSTQDFEIVTLFPEAVTSFASAGLLGRAAERGLVRVFATNPRDFTDDRHRTVDDTPYGGGPGMVMKAEPIVRALEALEAERGPTHRVLLTPAAPRFDQRAARRLATLPRIALLCGRYEGIDDRVREHFVHEALCVGDFVLNGGEVAALAILEAVARLREGVLGNPDSARHESHEDTADGPWLEYPQYTRPSEFRGHRVPSILLGGDHGRIAAWRAETARRRTWAVRADLRRPEPLPAGVEIWWAVPGDLPPDGQWVELLRGSGPGGLLLVGDGAADAVPGWARLLGGRVPVQAVAQLGTWVRRLGRNRVQRAGRVEVLALVPSVAEVPQGARGELAGVSGPAAADPTGALLDELRGRAGGEVVALIVMLGQPPWEGDASPLALRVAIPDSSPPLDLVRAALPLVEALRSRSVGPSEIPP